MSAPVMTAAEAAAPLDDARASESEASIAYLKAFDPDGRHNLVGIHPDTGGIQGRTFAAGRWGEMREWIKARNGGLNIYYSENEPVADAPDGKLRKEHIARIRAVAADLDPRRDVDLAVERTRLADLVERMKRDPLNRPSFILDSGGGFQMIWKLGEPLDARKHQDWAEGVGRSIARELGGDQIGNIDRILRLPGTTNLPTAVKAKQGRRAALASLVFESGETHEPKWIEEWAPPIASDARPDASAEITSVAAAINMAEVRAAAEYDELPEELRRRFEDFRAAEPSIGALWEGDRAARPGKDESGSGFAFALGIPLRRSGKFTVTEFGQLLFVWDCVNAEKLDARYIARAWARNDAMPAEEEFGPVETEGWRPDSAESTLGNLLARFGVVNIADHKWTDNQRYIVKGLLAPKNVGLLTGEPGTGKTPIGFDLAACIAKGSPWCGMKTQKGYVLHLSTEGAGGIMNRIEAQKRHHFPSGSDTPPLDTAAATIDLTKKKTVEELVLLIDARAAEFNVPPALLVIDTLSNALGGQSEAEEHVARAVVANCKLIAERTGAAVILLHHPTKSGSSKFRGSSVLLFDTDLQIDLNRGKKKSDPHTMTTPRPKDFEAIRPRIFRIVQIELGQDRDGDKITSTLIDWCGEAEREFDVGATPEQTEALHALNEIVRLRESEISDDAPIWIKTGDWKDACQIRQPRHGKPPSARTLERRFDALAQLGLVERFDGPKHMGTLWKPASDSSDKPRQIEP